jgi:hypothetical protein
LVYRYYCIENEVVPGLVPRGVVKLQAADEDMTITDEEGQIRRNVFGYIEVERKLTNEEMRKYGLEE